MKVSDLGEFGLIERISELTYRYRDQNTESWARLIVPIGDDAAAWTAETGLMLATTDTLVENVHFLPGTFDYAELGWKALGANLSDIAAMGGEASYALVSLSLPGSADVDDILRMYQGMLDLGRKHGVAIVGGNITSAPMMVVTIAVYGRAEPDKLLLRSAALPGDLIAVTGSLGASAGALAAMENSALVDKAMGDALRRAHFMFEPRMAEGKTLAANGIRCAIDISDGLIADLTQICRSSNVGAEVQATCVPIHPAVQRCFGSAQALALAMSGGEDYELLFCGQKPAIERIKALLTVPVSIIGSLAPQHPGTVMVRDDAGRQMKMDVAGWDHFKIRYTL